jgi:hypothetical protein
MCIGHLEVLLTLTNPIGRIVAVKARETHARALCDRLHALGMHVFFVFRMLSCHFWHKFCLLKVFKSWSSRCSGVTESETATVETARQKSGRSETMASINLR